MSRRKQILGLALLVGLMALTGFLLLRDQPVATLLQEQQTVDIQGRPTTLKARGRHDPCVLPRAVPIVEAMAAMTLLDQYLLNKTSFL